MIRREQRSLYDIYYIHDNNKVNDIAECNLIHDILKFSKRVKRTNSQYSPIIHGCINTPKGKSKFKIFWILSLYFSISN